MEKTADLVIGSSLGSELSNDEAGVLADLMTYRDVADGEFLIEEGASEDTLHVLLSGKFEVVKSTGAGETDATTRHEIEAVAQPQDESLLGGLVAVGDGAGEVDEAAAVDARDRRLAIDEQGHHVDTAAGNVDLEADPGRHRRLLGRQPIGCNSFKSMHSEPPLHSNDGSFRWL